MRILIDLPVSAGDLPAVLKQLEAFAAARGADANEWVAAVAARAAEAIKAAVPEPWRQVDVVLPEGAAIGVVEDRDGRLVMSVRAPGGDWPAAAPPPAAHLMEVPPGKSTYSLRLVGADAGGN